MLLTRLILLVLSFIVVSSGVAQEAQTSASDPSNILTVAVKPAAPFVIPQANGEYTGISIALWEQIAAQLNLDYEYQETDLGTLLDGVAQGRFDLGVGALTITAEREARFDFSQPFFTSELAIAVASKKTPGWLLVAERFLSLEFLSAAAALFAVLLLAGFLVWLFERRHHSEQFSHKPVRGIAAGIWWAAVTMTTVGYGDKAPQTLGGRLVATVWMFTAVIVIASFTASIASSLTVGQLSTGISGPQDLAKVQVGSLPDSTSADYLDAHGIGYQEFAQLTGALDALIAEKVDAVVYDAPLLRYQLGQRGGGEVRLLPNGFDPQNYGFALPDGSEMRESLDRELLALTAEPSWQATLQRYLGQDYK